MDMQGARPQIQGRFPRLATQRKCSASEVPPHDVPDHLFGERLK
jgi:hypothetical protein